jgi:hypothetical protein
VTRRKERVAPPPRPDGWDFRFATSDATKGWDQVCAAAPANARVAWEQLTNDPRRHDNRQHRLKGSLGTRIVNGATLEQWQYEVTAGGRIWFCIDDASLTVWMTDASVGHPKSTE